MKKDTLLSAVASVVLCALGAVGCGGASDFASSDTTPVSASNDDWAQQQAANQAQQNAIQDMVNTQNMVNQINADAAQNAAAQQQAQQQMLNAQ